MNWQPFMNSVYVELKQHLGKSFFLSISNVSSLDMRSVFKIFIPGGQNTAKKKKKNKAKQANKNKKKTNNSAQTGLESRIYRLIFLVKFVLCRYKIFLKNWC